MLQQIASTTFRDESQAGPLRWCIGLIAVLALGGAPTVGAWGYLGHQVAGDIAERFLDDAVAARVAALLGGESLADASIWADRMRSDPAPFWQDRAGPYHYVTVPTGRSYRDVGAPVVGDGVAALAMFRRELQDPDTPKERQRLALRFAIHIIQDLQQPLHVGNGRDRGGNDVSLEYAGETTNLHRVWDVHLLEAPNLDRRGWVRRLDDAGLLATPEGGQTDPLQWVGESAALRDTLYPPPRRIDRDYLVRHLPIAEKRLALAGLRSAAWLNEVLGAPQR